MDPEFWRHMEQAKELSEQLNKLDARNMLQEAMVDLNELHAAQKAMNELAQYDRPLVDWSALRAMQDLTEAQRGLDSLHLDQLAVQGLLNPAQAQNHLATAIDAQEQMRRALDPDAVRDAARIAQQVTQANPDYLDQAMRHVREVGAASVLDEAIETLRSPLTRSLIEQASPAALADYAGSLTQVLPDELPDGPMGEEDAFD